MPPPFSLPPFSNLDIYVPALRLAFEYQGRQHYEDLHASGQGVLQAKHDDKKARACLTAGITLLRIPHWDQVTPEALLNAIVAVRPELKPLLQPASGKV